MTDPALVANTDMGWGYSTFESERSLGWYWSSTALRGDSAYQFVFASTGGLWPSYGFDSDHRYHGDPIRYIDVSPQVQP